VWVFNESPNSGNVLRLPTADFGSLARNSFRETLFHVVLGGFQHQVLMHYGWFLSQISIAWS